MTARTSTHYAAPAETRWIERMTAEPPRARVGVFSDSYLPRISGVVRSIVSFVTELRRQGHYASIFATRFSATSAIGRNASISRSRTNAPDGTMRTILPFVTSPA